MYKLVFLPLAMQDILETEASLYKYSSAASDRLVDEIDHLTDALTRHPLMYQRFDEDDFYRSMPLPYGYRLFYHVVEETKTVEVHRLLNGRMDLQANLRG